MCPLAVAREFTPTKFPNCRPPLPLRSNQASVLHRYPLRSGNGLPAGTIQAQIVFQRSQEYLINGWEDGRGYCFAAEITVANIIGEAVDVYIGDHFPNCRLTVQWRVVGLRGLISRSVVLYRHEDRGDGEFPQTLPARHRPVARHRFWIDPCSCCLLRHISR